MAAALLGDGNQFSVDRSHGQYLGRNQSVMHDDIRLRDQARSTQRQQFRITRTRADEKDGSRELFGHAGQMAEALNRFNSECFAHGEGKFGG